MRKFLLIVVLLTAGCNSAPSPTQEKIGNPAVYQRIANETDCVVLQGEFDQADATSKRPGGPAGTTWLKIGIAYMEAADERMEEVGCYN